MGLRPSGMMEYWNSGIMGSGLRFTEFALRAGSEFGGNIGMLTNII